MIRRIVLCGLFVLAVLTAFPRSSQADGFCDNSGACYSVCVIIDSQGNRRVYVINRGGPGC